MLPGGCTALQGYGMAAAFFRVCFKGPPQKRFDSLFFVSTNKISYWLVRERVLAGAEGCWIGMGPSSHARFKDFSFTLEVHIAHRSGLQPREKIAKILPPSLQLVRHGALPACPNPRGRGKQVLGCGWSQPPWNSLDPVPSCRVR